MAQDEKPKDPMAEVFRDLIAQARRAAPTPIVQRSTSTSAASGTAHTFGPGTTISAPGGTYGALQQPTKEPKEGKEKVRRAARKHPTEELPADTVRYKRVHYDQVRAIAMAPRDKIGGLGWATLGGFTASLPATAQDIWASYISRHPVALPPGRLIDIIVTVTFLVAFVVALIKRREATSEELLKKLFPEPEKEDV